jgi:RNA recognition motif-containing protein
MSQTQNSTNLNSLWIGELDNWMDDNYIKKAINNYNIELKSIKIMKDKNSGTSLGYGFLEFEDKEIANNALKTLNGQPLPNSNKVFKLNWASYNNNKNVSNPNEYSIYVCDLDPSVNEETLTNFFKEKYNSVISSKIVVDPSTKISKGYGFVKFSDKSESEKAINEMNGKLINGKAMKTGNASYKKNEKKQNNNNNINTNYQPDLNALQNDPNFLLQQQQYLAQFYLANGYQPNINPLAYQLYAQLMNQNMNQNQNFGNNLQSMGNDNMNPNQQMQGQDLQQFLNKFAMLQMMGAGGTGMGGDMNAMMGTNNENNQDNQ